MQLGFVGLGRMGGNMVHRLARGGRVTRIEDDHALVADHAATVRLDRPAPQARKDPGRELLDAIVAHDAGAVRSSLIVTSR